MHKPALYGESGAQLSLMKQDSETALNFCSPGAGLHHFMPPKAPRVLHAVLPLGAPEANLSRGKGWESLDLCLAPCRALCAVVVEAILMGSAGCWRPGF